MNTRTVPTYKQSEREYEHWLVAATPFTNIDVLGSTSFHSASVLLQGVDQKCICLEVCMKRS